jgi:transposase
MFWAAFCSAARRTGLIPLFRDPEVKRRGITGLVIKELYRRILPTLVMNQDSIFQHDNAPTHTATVVRDALAEMEIDVMECSPCSPDLNPIENLWALLKAKIYELRPDLVHMRNNDQTKEILVATAQQAWDELDIRHLEHLSETMPHRVEAIIESDGWYTPY